MRSIRFFCDFNSFVGEIFCGEFRREKTILYVCVAGLLSQTCVVEKLPQTCVEEKLSLLSVATEVFPVLWNSIFSFC